MAVTYDQSLPIIVEIVHGLWGASALEENIFLRDASGRVTFVVLNHEKNGSSRESLSKMINAQLGGYADPSGISVATPEELFDESLRQTGIGSLFPVKSQNFKGLVRIVDRRVVGADWLRPPTEETISIPRLFFVSLKGGVGRSTALCVLASHLATNGRRVLAVDLDIEAPGLGTMLLDNSSLPKFGILDYLVESNLSTIDDIFMMDMLAASQLAAGRGIVTVIPVLGSMSNEYPENVLGKIARAYLPSDSDPSLLSLTTKIEKLLNFVTGTGDYDVVLIDARAGLHELTAAAAVSMRGDTLLFGINQPQTFVGFRALLAQLAVTLGSDWAARLHFVEARVGPDGPSGEFLSNITAIMPEGADSSISGGIPLDRLRGTFDVEWDEETPASQTEAVLHSEVDSTYIYESDIFRGFDPLKSPDRLERGVYAAVFADFLQRCDEILNATESSIAGATKANG